MVAARGIACLSGARHTGLCTGRECWVARAPLCTGWPCAAAVMGDAIYISAVCTVYVGDEPSDDDTTSS